MHSPPPTPQTRSNGSTNRIAHVVHGRFDATDRAQQSSRKRNLEQAGLITPRETPRKKDVAQGSRGGKDQTAKVLFPSAKRRKFEVFQDPRSPDPFSDDAQNPFAMPTTKAHNKNKPDSTDSVSQDELQGIVEDESNPAVPRTTTQRSLRASTEARRTDGMTYVFRGRKVFRKFETLEDAEEADAVKPKLLFQKEMAAPKLSNPFTEDSTDDEFDGLELSTYPSTTSTMSKIGAARKLF